MATASQRIYFVSLGCPKNQVDTELMLGQVEAAGHAQVDAPEAADVIVVNTCAFIDAAKEESADTILEMAEYKKAGTAKLVVTGCLAQRYSDDLVKDIPEIDHILGSSDFQPIAKILGPAPKTNGRRKKLPVVQVTEPPAYIYDPDAPRARIDWLCLRTTFIVCHPGETEDEFKVLCDFVAESSFDRACAFTYSIEPG